MNHRIILTLLGAALVTLGLLERGWALLAVWLGGDFLALAAAHQIGAHRVFGKRGDGTIPWWSWVLFLPLLVFTLVVWHLIRRFSQEPAQSIVTEQLVVGRRLLPREVDCEFANYVDLTAEFVEPSAMRRSAGYVSFPILDAAAPSPTILREAVASLRPGRTYVHCAQGHGRTGLFALAVLVVSQTTPSVEDGLRKLRAVRPGIRLSKVQRECIQALFDQVARQRDSPD